MGKNIKFILIGLGGFVLIFFFLFMQTAASKRQVVREREDLKKENTSLNTKIEKMQGAFRDYENRITSLGKELDKTSRDKKELEGRLDVAGKAKDELTEKIKSLQGQLAQAAKQESPAFREQPSGDAYWASILRAKTDLELKLSDMRSELKSIQITNEQLQREKANTELDIKNLKVENADLKRQVDYNQKVMDSIAQELVRERNDKSKIEEAFKAIKTENNLLTRQLTSLTSRKVSLERKLQQIQEEKKVQDRRFSELEMMLSDKLSQIEDIKQKVSIAAGTQDSDNTINTPEGRKGSVELSPIVVRPDSGIPVQPNSDSIAKVLKVDRENNFVIIDAGEESGIRVGNTFRVYRQGEKIAVLEVIKVSQTVSACDIKEETVSVRIGDKIR